MTSTLADIPPATADFGGNINARQCDGHSNNRLSSLWPVNSDGVESAPPSAFYSAQMRAIRAGRTPADGQTAMMMKGPSGAAFAARFSLRVSDLLPAGCACPSLPGAAALGLFEV